MAPRAAATTSMHADNGSAARSEIAARGFEEKSVRMETRALRRVAVAMRAGGEGRRTTWEISQVMFRDGKEEVVIFFLRNGHR